MSDIPLVPGDRADLQDKDIATYLHIQLEKACSQWPDLRALGDHSLLVA